MKFDHVLKAGDYSPLNIKWINEFCKAHSKEIILLEVPSTKCLKAEELATLNANIYIRIAGAYDEDRIRRYKDETFGKEDVNAYYYDSVVYSRWEAIKIMEAIEKIEKDIFPSWTNKQKIIYIYDYLKRHISYDPKYEKKSSKEVRSLRGLISKETVCAGYALILKELLERQNIKCHYVRGNGHAWNIIEDEGKLYPVDLTWEGRNFRNGEMSTFDYLGQNIEDFNKQHKPDEKEPFKDYQSKLTILDTSIIQQMKSILNRERDYTKTFYRATREDGSRFNVAQVGRKEIDGVVYYRYYYQEIDEKGHKKDPRIFYSESNITRYFNAKKFKKPIPPEYEQRILNVLFSKENITDTEKKNTCYLGRISNPNMTGYYQNWQDIPKPMEKQELFRFPTKVYHRSDGTSFLVQRTVDTERVIGDYTIYQYDIFETIKEDGEEVLKKNCIYTEKPFMRDTRQRIADSYLSRRRIDKKVKETGGYIGYMDENGTRISNQELCQYFDISKKITEKKYPITIPTFEECKDLVLKYTIDSKTCTIKERSTGKFVSDPEISKKAMFANLWCSAAGVKVNFSSEVWGLEYAFNEPAKKIYETMVKRFTKDVQKTGTINTVGMFEEAGESSYKYAEEIILRLFRTPLQTQAINELFHMALAPNKVEIKDPETLYNWEYVGQLLRKEERNK